MAKKDPDILLIRKYLNGELDARAMHQLEARAQDDPFLMDALEAYEKAGDQQSSLADLSARLQQRVERKEVRRIIPFRYLAIAASVLVVFTVGGLLMVKNKPQVPSQIAENIKPEPKTQSAAPVAKDTTATLQLAQRPAIKAEKNAKVISRSQATISDARRPAPAAAPDMLADKTALKELAVAKADVTTKADTTADTTPLNEIVVMNYKPEKKKDALSDESYGYSSPPTPKPVATMEQQLVSKAAGVSNTPGLSPLASPGSQKIYVQGRIIDEIDRQPLPGVFVKAAGSSYGAVTDKNGRFYVPSDSLKRGLVVSRLGYNTAKVNAPKGDSLKTISLAPSDFPLKEAAIANNVKNPTAAHPQIGWNKYNKYLGTAAVSPDGKTGSVGLSFLVDKSGTISNIAIVTSLSDAANKKATDLVNKGPKWVGNVNGKTEQVTLTINF